jgi:hypothetical protein
LAYERLDDYLRFDLRARRDFRLRRGLLALYLEVTNLFNRDNIGRPERFSFYTRPEGSVGVNIEREGWMPMITSLGLRWTF